MVGFCEHDESSDSMNGQHTAISLKGELHTVSLVSRSPICLWPSYITLTTGHITFNVKSELLQQILDTGKFMSKSTMTDLGFASF